MKVGHKFGKFFNPQGTLLRARWRVLEFVAYTSGFESRGSHLCRPRSVVVVVIAGKLGRDSDSDCYTTTFRMVTRRVHKR